ncbi:MAG: GAF domain-containing protein [Pseudomonadota bacterium]|nr:GAF domain-containing protein [Pseudomonadota bacterium]
MSELPSSDALSARPGPRPEGVRGPTGAPPPFIRAIEIWAPDLARERLRLVSALHGPLVGFAAATRDLSFGHDEGLPGKAWAEGRPVILHDLTNSYFLRGEAAAAAGLTCGVAIPVFAGAFLQAGVVMFLGVGKSAVGAVELWRAAPGSPDMTLADGHFGVAEGFEFSARHTTFRKGVGLPGLAWQAGGPVLMDDLGRAKQFLRRESAESVGINRGVALPCPAPGDDGTWVLALLSAAGTPIARRFETWAPDGERLTLTDSMGEGGAAGFGIDAGEGLIGKVWRSGIPALCDDLSREATALTPPHAALAAAAGLRSAVALPAIEGGRLHSILVWYL